MGTFKSHTVAYSCFTVAYSLTAIAKLSPHGLWYYSKIVKDFCPKFFYLARKICRGYTLFRSTV